MQFLHFNYQYILSKGKWMNALIKCPLLIADVWVFLFLSNWLCMTQACAINYIHVSKVQNQSVCPQSTIIYHVLIKISSAAYLWMKRFLIQKCFPQYPTALDKLPWTTYCFIFNVSEHSRFLSSVYTHLSGL